MSLIQSINRFEVYNATIISAPLLSPPTLTHTHTLINQLTQTIAKWCGKSIAFCTTALTTSIYTAHYSASLEFLSSFCFLLLFVVSSFLCRIFSQLSNLMAQCICLCLCVCSLILYCHFKLEIPLNVRFCFQFDCTTPVNRLSQSTFVYTFRRFVAFFLLCCYCRCCCCRHCCSCFLFLSHSLSVFKLYFHST